MSDLQHQQKLPGNPSLPSSSDELMGLIEKAEGNYKYTVEDFFRNPEQTGFKISPCGGFLAFAGPYERRQNVFVCPASGGEPVRITHETDRDIAGFFWANSNRIVYVKDSGGDENFQLFAVDRDGENPRDLTPFQNVKIEFIDNLEDQEDELIIGMNKDNPMLFEPYRLNVRTGDYQRLAPNDNPQEPITAWMTDHEGRLRLAIKTIDGVNQHIMYRAGEEDTFRTVVKTNFKESLSPLFFDFDNGSIAFCVSDIGRDRSEIIRFDFEKGEEVGPAVFSHPEVDAGSLLYSRKRKVLLGAVYTTWKRQIDFFDAQRKEMQDRLERLLPGYEVVAVSSNKAEDKFVIRTYSDRSLGAYYYYDLAEDSIRKIADVSPWIDEEDMAAMKAVSFTTSAGEVVHGYLTIPKGKNGQKVPVVINPHGGPWVRDSWGV